MDPSDFPTALPIFGSLLFASALQRPTDADKFDGQIHFSFVGRCEPHFAISGNAEVNALATHDHFSLLGIIRYPEARNHFRCDRWKKCVNRVSFRGLLSVYYQIYCFMYWCSCLLFACLIVQRAFEHGPGFLQHAKIIQPRERNIGRE